MRREAVIFPVLDEPVLVMGMPAIPFLLATVAAFLLPTLCRFHVLSLAPLVAYPFVMAVLRRHGRQDPKRFEIYLHFRFVERRFYQPAPYVFSNARRRIDRRAFLL